MKILYVSGDGDYMALTFEDEMTETAKEMWDKAMKEKNHIWWDEDGYISFEALEFDKVDPKFITWLQGEVVDYDDAKHSAFYVVEE